MSSTLSQNDLELRGRRIHRWGRHRGGLGACAGMR